MTTRNVHFFLAPDHLFGSFELYRSEALEGVRANRSKYRLAGMIPTNLVGEAAAEMVFDISNNPSKETIKESMGWTGRSLSVGDIVVVDGVCWSWPAFSFESADRAARWAAKKIDWSEVVEWTDRPKDWPERSKT